MLTPRAPLQNSPYPRTALPMLLPRPHKCGKCQDYWLGERFEDYKSAVRARPDRLLRPLYCLVDIRPFRCYDPTF